jgi:hypothetical protein
MIKIFNLRILIIFWILTALIGCSSTKTLHQTSSVKDSSSMVAAKTTIVKKSDSSFHNYGKKSILKTDKGTIKVREKNTEVTTDDWQAVKAKTKPSDYFDKDVKRINDSLLLVNNKKHTNITKKTSTEKKNAADSIGETFIQGGDIAHADSTTTENSGTTVTHAETKQKDLHKETSWRSWQYLWFLLIIPVLYAMYRYAKKKSFLTKIFP